MSKTTVIYKDVAPGADEVAVFESENETEFSELDLLRKENEQRDISTLERNLWTLDGRQNIYNNDIVPFWSRDLSDENGVFAVPPSIEITLPQLYSSVGMTLQFDSNLGAFCSDMNIKWFHDDQLVSDADFHPDSDLYFCAKRAESYNRIILTFRKTFLPYRRVKLRQVIFGVIRKFGMDELRSAHITNNINLLSTEVPICTMNLTLDSASDIDFMFQFKQPMEVWNDDFMLGVYYISESSRKSKSVYDLKCKDAFGVLDEDTFQGGVYVDYSAKQLMLDIVDGAFEIDFGTVDDMLLTGLLPEINKRGAMQNVLFAWGVCAATDGGYKIRIFKPGDEPKVIPQNRVYTGVSVQTSSIVTAVQVTAHTYTESPDGEIEIDGKLYKDEKTVYTVSNADVTANDKKNVKKIANANFVTKENGQEIAQRVYDFYTKRDTENGKIVWRGEKLGDCVTVPDSWDGTHTGNISWMDIVLSNTVAASCKVIS